MHYGVDGTGVTLAEEQTESTRIVASRNGASTTTRASCAKTTARFRTAKFDKIVSLEMVEHVGVKNLQSYYDGVYDLLEDDGIFLCSGPVCAADCAPKTSSGVCS